MSIGHYGWVPDLPDDRDLNYAAPAEFLTALPTRVDLRPQCPPVYDQGSLGSCTVNAIAGAFEFERLRHKLQDFVPSRLFIYYNGRQQRNTVNSDSGVQIRDGMRVVARLGAPAESDWPYDISKFAEKPPARAYADAYSSKAISYQRLKRDLKQFKGCLASGRPFVFGFTAYDNFESAEVAHSGRLPMPQPGESVCGGHAVVAVGYDDKQQAFIARNSWGSDWGLKGYFTLPYEYLMNPNLSDDFWTVHIAEEIPSPEPGPKKERSKGKSEATVRGKRLDWDRMPRRVLSEGQRHQPAREPRKTTARYVNVGITSGSNHIPVPKSRSLQPNGEYALQINIGQWSRKSAVKNPIPVPTEKLPAAQEGHWLEVIAISDDFRLFGQRYHMFLPRAGESFLCNCTPGTSHKCNASQRKPHLFISITAPSLDSLSVRNPVLSMREGRPHPAFRPARLRLAIYFQRNLVQSLLLSANLRGVGAEVRGYRARIDYSLTSRLSDLSFLAPRALHVLTNDNTDQSHKLIINADLENPISFDLAEGQMEGAIAAARQTLKDISVKEFGGQLGAKVQYQNLYDRNNSKPKDAFIDDLRVLAPLGWMLWATLFQRQPEARKQVSGRLRQASQRPATIQVSRVEGSSLVFPWSLIYDIPLEGDPTDFTLCESLTQWNTHAKEVLERCPFEQQHPKKNVICPFGFWGFNHVIEQAPSMPRGRALSTAIKKAGAHDKAQLVMGISLDLDPEITQAHKDKLEHSLTAIQLIPKDSRESVETALGQEELELVYFYCHGRRESLAGSKATTPYIEVGKKEGIAPGDIIAWQTADWNDNHWKHTSPLVFINGCHTAELTPELLLNFVDSFIGVYAAGVIGTEILIHQEVAGEAAEQALLNLNDKDKCGEHIGVGQAIRKMRLHFLGKGNLLGLAYTPYCSADLKLTS